MDIEASLAVIVPIKEVLQCLLILILAPSILENLALCGSFEPCNNILLIDLSCSQRAAFFLKALAELGLTFGVANLVATELPRFAANLSLPSQQ